MDVKKLPQGALKWTRPSAMFVGLLIRTTEKYHHQCTDSAPVFRLLQDKHSKLQCLLHVISDSISGYFVFIPKRALKQKNLINANRNILGFYQ
jgi:hypothetical protein